MISTKRRPAKDSGQDEGVGKCELSLKNKGILDTCTCRCRSFTFSLQGLDHSERTCQAIVNPHSPSDAEY